MDRRQRWRQPRGGMFTLMRIREGLAANDFSDPGPHKHPEGTVAYEIEAAPGAPSQQIGGTTTKRAAVDL